MRDFIGISSVLFLLVPELFELLLIFSYILRSGLLIESASEAGVFFGFQSEGFEKLFFFGVGEVVEFICFVFRQRCWGEARGEVAAGCWGGGRRGVAEGWVSGCGTAWRRWGGHIDVFKCW